MRTHSLPSILRVTWLLAGLGLEHCVLSSGGGGEPVDSPASNGAANSSGGDASTPDAPLGGTTGTPPGGGSGTTSGGTSGTTSGGTTGTTSGGTTGTTPLGGSSSGSTPAGWLYTKDNHIYLSDGTAGTQWMGRGSNIDDLFLCGNDMSLSKVTSDTQTLESIIDNLMTWKPNFIRTSLYLKSGQYTVTVDWANDTYHYATNMKAVVDYIGTNYPGVYVLVSLRSDASMDCSNGENTCLPTAGTSAVYTSLVDAFASSSFVMFGIANEPGGVGGFSNAQLIAGMNTAANAIRAEEDKLHVPHHIISVQGQLETSDLSVYVPAKGGSPITADNVVYEVHYYPATATSDTPAKSYDYNSKIPVIIGEYGGPWDHQTQAAFYADMESMQIPNLAWDYEPMSDCNPDLVNWTGHTDAAPTAFGTTVKTYLLAHAAP